MLMELISVFSLILFCFSYLGNSLWTTLKSLAEKVSGTGTYNVLHDKRFTGNGIEITFHKGKYVL